MRRVKNSGWDCKTYCSRLSILELLLEIRNQGLHALHIKDKSTSFDPLHRFDFASRRLIETA